MQGRVPPLVARCLAEILGTFILIFFGCGAVHTATLLSAQQGIWQVGIVWGVAIMLAIYVIGGISGAHINPAISVAMTLFRKLPVGHLLPYVGSQLLGAFLASAALFALYHPQINKFEQEHSIIRGQPGSELTASCYCEYYPNPGADNHAELYKEQKYDQLNQKLCGTAAFLAEVLGTLLLALVVFALTDKSNTGAPPSHMAAVFIGLSVALIISVIGPLTQACLNPARDWGPRLFTALAGWGKVAIPGPNGIGIVTVYIIAPILGASLGGVVYHGILRAQYPPPDVPEDTSLAPDEKG